MKRIVKVLELKGLKIHYDFKNWVAAKNESDDFWIDIRKKLIYEVEIYIWASSSFGKHMIKKFESSKEVIDFIKEYRI